MYSTRKADHMNRILAAFDGITAGLIALFTPSGHL
jgi:hypothetical protein